MTGRAQPRSLHDGKIDRYLAEIRRFPVLDETLERELAARYRNQGDEAAGDRLIRSHLRLAAKIAVGYRGYGMPLSDLISEGNLGIVEAVKRFDPNRGVRFATYATWWIRAAIQAYVLRSRSLVKMGTTAAQKKLFFNLAGVKARLGLLEVGDLSEGDVARIAEHLHVPAAEVVQMNRRLSAADPSLQMPSEDGTDWQESIADETENQEMRLAEREVNQTRRKLLRQALVSLESREREIVEMRCLSENPPSLTLVAGRYGVSPERIRQIELAAVAKLRKAVSHSSLPPQTAPRVQAA